MAISRTEAVKEIGQMWNEIMAGTGLPNKLRCVKGVEITRNDLISLYPGGVQLKWIDFYKVGFTGCIGKKVIIGDK